MKNKTGAILLSIVIALGLWVYVSTVVTTTIDKPYYNLQIALEGESALTDRGLMLVSVENDEVDLTLHGSRSNLGKVSASDIQLVADLTTIWSAGTYELNYTIGYPGDVPSGSVSELSKRPDRVTVVVAERDTKEVPVKVSYIGSAADGYIMDPSAVMLSHAYVTVTGPRDVVASIDHASVEVDCTKATETFATSQRFVLCDEDNEPVDASLITVNVEQIQIRVPVEMLKTIPLTINVIDGGGATEELCDIQIGPVGEIGISGSATALENINELVLGTVNLGEVTEESWERSYRIMLPDGVTNRSGINEVSVTITFPELITREFTITNIQGINLAEGMQVDLLTKQLTVQIRGEKTQVESLTEADILAQVDLTNVKNTAALEPTFIFDSKFPNVGALGRYTISVSVSPADS